MTDTHDTDTPPPIGRPADVSDDAIIEAGNALLAAGSRITGYALRRKLGDKGEAKRLMRVWKAHDRSHQVLDAEPVQDLPVEVDEALKQVTTALVDQINGLARKLNATAVQTAERRIAEALAAARDTQEQAEAELEDAAATVEDLEEKLQALKEIEAQQAVKLEEAAAREKRDQSRVSELERELAVAKEKWESEREQRESAEIALKDQQERNGELKRDKEDIRKERDQLRSQVEKQQDKITDLEGQRDNLVSTREEMKAQLSGITEREQAALQRALQYQEERDTARQEAAGAARAEAVAGQLQDQLDKLMERFSLASDDHADEGAKKTRARTTSGKRKSSEG